MALEIFDPSGGGGSGGGGGGGLVVLDPVTTTSGTYADVVLPAGVNDAVYVAISITGLRHNSTGNERYQLTLGTDTFTGAGTNNNPEISGDLSSSQSLNKLIVLRKVSKTSNKWRLWSDNGGNVLLNQESVLNAPLGRIRIGLHSVSGTERFNGGEIAVQYSALRGSVGGTSTSHVPEGANLYWTQARFDTAFAAKNTSSLTEGTNLYWTQARFDTAFGNKTTSNLTEGSNLYYTDARARGALSASGIISYNSGTGAFSTDTAGLATAVNGILSGGTDIGITQSGNTITIAYTGTGGGGGGSTTITGLSDVASTATTTGQIYVKGTGTQLIPTTISAGSNVTITNGGTGTLTISASGSGGGGGATTLSGLSDVSESSPSAGQALIYVGGGNGWANGLISTAGLGDGAVTSAKLEISSGTATLSDSDGLVVKDGSTYEVRTKRFMESTLHSVHTKDLDLGSYSVATGVLPTAAGQCKILSTTLNNVTTYTLAIFPRNDDDRRDLLEIFTSSFRAGIQKTGDSFFGIVDRTSTVPGAQNLVACVFEVGSEVGNASISGDVTMVSRGRAIRWDHLDQSVGSGADADKQRVASKKAVHDAIPVAASDRDADDGTDNTRFITSKTLRDQEASVLDDMTWSGFVYNANGVDGSVNNSVGEDENIDDLYQFVSTDAITAAMDSRFKPGDIASIELSDLSKRTEGRVQYADRRRVGNTARWIFEFKLRDGAGDTITRVGNFNNDESLTLRHESRLHAELVDEGFLQTSDLVGGTNVTLTTTGNQITINASGGGGTFATEAQAKAATSTNTIMAPATTDDWFDKKVQIGNFTTSDGFTLATSGSDIAQDHFWFQSGAGNSLNGRIRGGSAADTNGLRDNLDGPHDLYFQNGNEWIFARMNGAATEADGSTGNSGLASNKEFRFTINEHRASTGAASATGAWSLTIYGNLPAALEEITPPFAFTPHVIKPGNHGQVMTSVNGRTEWAASGGSWTTNTQSFTTSDSGISLGTLPADWEKLTFELGADGGYDKANTYTAFQVGTVNGTSEYGSAHLNGSQGNLDRKNASDTINQAFRVGKDAATAGGGIVSLIRIADDMAEIRYTRSSEIISMIWNNVPTGDNTVRVGVVQWSVSTSSFSTFKAAGSIKMSYR